MPYQTFVTTQVYFHPTWAHVPGWAQIAITNYINAHGPFNNSFLEHHVNAHGVHKFYLHAHQLAAHPVVRLHAAAPATPSNRMPIFPPVVVVPVGPMASNAAS